MSLHCSRFNRIQMNSISKAKRQIIKQLPNFLNNNKSALNNLHTTSKCKEHERVNEEKFKNVNDHASKGDLERPQMRIHAKDVHELKEANGTKGVRTFGMQRT